MTTGSCRCDTVPIEVTPSDDRRLVVDAFARYRIADVVQFRQAVGVGGIRAAEDRLQSILNAQIREVLGLERRDFEHDPVARPGRADARVSARRPAERRCRSGWKWWTCV